MKHRKKLSIGNKFFENVNKITNFYKHGLKINNSSMAKMKKGIILQILHRCKNKLILRKFYDNKGDNLNETEKHIFQYCHENKLKNVNGPISTKKFFYIHLNTFLQRKKCWLFDFTDEFFQNI